MSDAEELETRLRQQVRGIEEAVEEAIQNGFVFNTPVDFGPAMPTFQRFYFGEEPPSTMGDPAETWYSYDPLHGIWVESDKAFSDRIRRTIVYWDWLQKFHRAHPEFTDEELLRCLEPWWSFSVPSVREIEATRYYLAQALAWERAQESGTK